MHAKQKLYHTAVDFSIVTDTDHSPHFSINDHQAWYL